VKKAELLNRMIVETNHGDRAFLLLEGDIFSEPADVYIFNAYSEESAQVSGSLVERLKLYVGREKMEAEPFYFSRNGITVDKIKLDQGRHVMLMHTNLKEYEAVTLTQYEEFIDTVFTCLSALEGYGVSLNTVAFPVLIRNGLHGSYHDAIKILINKAMKWLKHAEATQVLKYVLFEDGDSELWNGALNEVLGRSVMDVNVSPELRNYQSDVLSWLKRFPRSSSYWEDTLLPIRNALQREDFRPDVLAAFSRKLVEVYTSDVCKMNNLESSSLEESFKLIKEHQLLDEWSIQTFRQIRAFGNPAIHRPDPLIGPKTPGERDVIILMISLCRLLEKVHDFVQTSEEQFR